MNKKRDFSQIDRIIDELDDNSKRDLMRLGLLRFIHLLPSVLGLTVRKEESDE